MFTRLHTRLMLSFSALLLVSLSIVTITLTLLLFVRISLPELAYAHLADAAAQALAELRSVPPASRQPAELFQAVSESLSGQDVRLLLVSLPEAVITADSEQTWVGQSVRGIARQNLSFALASRGRARGPDGSRLLYMVFPVPTGQNEQGRRLVLVTTLGQTVRPLIGSIVSSVLISGAAAFLLSILLALWLARTIANPLQRAAMAAEAVAAGDYSATLDIKAPDEARRLAESFNSMTRAVAAAQRSQRDLVANVSHELKTPLTSIKGFAQAILDGTASDQASVQQAAAVIHQEADRLSRLVYGLLDLARLESGANAMSWHTVDLGALIHSCADRFRPLASQRSVQFQIQCDEQLSLVADGDRLTQVITNLLDNALKHTDPGGRVAIEAHREADRMHLSVTDTGVGIPKADLPRVLERFYQVDKSRSRRPGTLQAGVGLGLAITSEIVRAHGGQIGVDSIVGVGTQFTVTLPCTPPAFKSPGREERNSGS